MRRAAALAILPIALLVALAARRYLSMRDAMAAVSADLRQPYLPFFPTSYSARTVQLWRLSAPRMSAGPGVTVVERRVGEPAVEVLVTAPKEHNPGRAAVLWIHSGGYVLGSPRIELPLAADLARDLGVVVISPAYRLAPEHPFPAAFDDCKTVLRWMRAHAGELDIDPARIAVGGGSAGGGLSAAIAQWCYDEEIPLCAQVLLYPMLDDRTALRDDFGGRGRLVWSPEAIRFGWTSYLGHAPGQSDPPDYAAPARRMDLSGLPPAWIGVGDLDAFHDEDVDYARRLAASGVACELVIVPGMYHGADGWASKAQSMKDFRAGMIQHFRTHLTAGT